MSFLFSKTGLNLHQFHKTTNLFHNFNETTIISKQSGNDKNENDKAVEYILKIMLKSHPSIQFLAIINTLIWVIWNVPELKGFMNDNFLDSAANSRKGRWWSGFLSSFSHQTMTHLFGNLSCLTIFGPPTYQFLGKERYIIFILLSAVLSLQIEAKWRDSKFSSPKLREISSLGFSGINSALFIIYAHTRPKDLISVGGKDFCTSKDALFTSISGDLIGFLVQFFEIYESPIGHAAHLSGYLVGYILLYGFYLDVFIEKKSLLLFKNTIQFIKKNSIVFLFGISISFLLFQSLDNKIIDNIKDTVSEWFENIFETYFEK